MEAGVGGELAVGPEPDAVARGEGLGAEEAIRRRYERSRKNFLRLRDVVDMWELYNSDGGQTVLVAKRVDEILVTFIEPLARPFL